MDILTGRLLRQAVPLFNTLAAVLLLLGISAILVLGKEVLVHLALGILLSFALAPIVNRLERLGLTRGLAVGGTILLALAVIAAIAFVGYSQATLFAGELPSYEATIRTKISGLSHELAKSGVFSNAADVLTRALADIQNIGTEGGAPAPQIPVVQIDTGAHGVSALYHYLEPLLHPLATLFVVLLLSAFILADRESLRNRFIRLVGTDDILQTTAALDDAGHRVGRMLLTQVALNAAFGLVIGTGLWLVGLPSPFLWGILAGILRFVPFIGAIIGLVPPLFVAFAIDPGWSSVLLTLGLFAVIEPIVGHVIEPLLYGHSSGLSPVAIIISATVWAFFWGPIGLVLSTPLTICLVVLGRYVKRFQFLDILLGDRPALAPHEIFYQRMLAGDPREAHQHAHAFIKGRSLSTYYDEIALEAIRRAHLDVVRGSVTGDRLDTLARTSEQLVAQLGTEYRPQFTKRRRTKAELEASFESIADAQRQRPVLQRHDLREAWQGDAPVAVLYGTNPLDGAAAQMLAQVLGRHGLPARCLKLEEAGNVTPKDAEGVALVCLSFVEPLSRLHLRAYISRVRRVARNAEVLLCIWQNMQPDLIAELKQQLHLKNIVTSTSAALDIALQQAQAPAQVPPAPAQTRPKTKKGLNPISV